MEAEENMSASLPLLRPYQTEALARWQKRRDKRSIWAHATGAGKTRVALEAARAIGAKRMLIVASANARPTWVREAARWTPELQPSAIRWGRANKSLSKKAQAEREAAYAAAVQVVSFDLLRDIDAGPRDLLIVDEAHRLKEPNSQQSQRLRAFMRLHPDMPALFLTATPIPKEVVDIWNLVDLLWPGRLGEATSSGEASWWFRRRYCLSELKTWDGGKATEYFGANPETLPELREKLAPLMHVVSAAEVAQYTPPLTTRVQWLDDPRVKAPAVAKDWLQDQDVLGVGLFCWKHETVAQLVAAAAKEGWATVEVTGHSTPEARQALLTEATEATAAGKCTCVVGTIGALSESISLSFVKRALVFEWRTSPGQALQFMGRFARADSTDQLPTFVNFVAWPDDVADADLLSTRLDAINNLWGLDGRTSDLRSAMVAPEQTPEQVKTLILAMLSESRPSLMETEDDE